MQTTTSLNTVRIHLRPRATCPHCWHVFNTEDTLWVAVHPELQHDPRTDVGGMRFLPTRFGVEGNAIDPNGMVCQDLACPQCHLRIPRPLLEMPPMFVSIAGTPSCGKTYFLASMTWRLRQILPQEFCLAFTDADPVSNLQLNEYENQQFFSTNPDDPVKLAKTEKEGGLYDLVTYGEQVVSYPRPFLFAIRPTEHHPNFSQAARISRLVCLYDNAGESFEPGEDRVSAPVTRHLAKAQVLMFCFDPTQDPRLREECRTSSQDPQVLTPVETRRQEPLFHEMVDRVRRHAGMHQNAKYKRPLVIIVTKFDVWKSLLQMGSLPCPWKDLDNLQHNALDLPAIDEVSSRVREMLWQYSPEMVSAAEAFAQHVIYVPASATGCSPIFDADSKTNLGFRPRDLQPEWTEVPLLVALAKWGGGMIPYAKKNKQK